MTVLRIAGILLALFVAYVVGRAAGILLGIGPWVTTAVAVAIVLVLLVRVAARGGR